MGQIARAGRGARRSLIGAGTVAAAGAMLLGAAGPAGAASTGAAQAATVNCATPYVPPVPAATMTLNSTGAAVTALQQRLYCLHYWVGSINGKLGWDTLFAVWAFKEVQARKISPPHPNVVDAATQAALALARPSLPPVTNPKGGATRIEVLKSIQVLVLYKNSKIYLITHVSTARYCRTDGCKWVTPNGKYHTLYWIPGKVVGHLGPLWNPVVYTPDGHYAIHGDLNPTSLAGINSQTVVSLTPASHGCIRIPMDLSKVFHTYVKLAGGTAGTPVYISGPAHQ